MSAVSGGMFFWFHRFDMVIGVIQGGTHEVVHGGIDHDEVFLFAVFDELDARQQRACVADQAAAGFEDQFQTTCTDQFLNRLGIRAQIGDGFVLINDADAAA